MRQIPTAIEGAYILEPELIHDPRGFFTVPFSSAEFIAKGLHPVIAQCNLAFNHKRGTMRGMHFQVAPATEVKVVRCVAGAIHDVIVDLRPESPSYLKWVGVELSAQNRLGFYIPPLCAHGYLTLTDAAEVGYQVSAPYTPDCARGYRPDDPAFAIVWPIETAEINARDAHWPLFQK